MTDHGNSLYGVKQASKTKTKAVSSSTSLAFSTNLASLISGASSSPAASHSRSRQNKSKSDIFTAHNKNVKKRSAADLVEDGEQRHKTVADLGTVDSDMLHRSKRRMEEKARLYAAMKRGDYVTSKDGRDERGLVDFDRKWAENQGSRADAGEDATSSGSDNDSDDDQELVEYEDEFGRTRKGTKAQAAREERGKRIKANAAEEAEQASARPTMPTNIIFGDTVQHNAFNPDEVIAERMAGLAQKRDKSATPPPDSHYDANAEIRNKGTGFYTFSKDAEGRKKEMEALERERLETERARKERDSQKEKRRKELEDRKRLIAEQRSKAQADKFLNGFELSDEKQDVADVG